MSWYHWTPCHVDPVDFECDECPVAAGARCALRTDDALRHEEAMRWRDYAGGSYASSGPGNDMLVASLVELLRQIGVSAPAGLLAEYVSKNRETPVTEEEVAALLRIARSVRERSPGMFAYSAGDQPATLVAAQDVSSGAMIGQFLLDSPPLPEAEHVAQLKRLGALRKLSTFATVDQATDVLQAEIDGLLDSVTRTEGWSLGDTVRFSLGPERLPLLRQTDGERLRARSDLLTAIASLELLRGRDLKTILRERDAVESELVTRNARLVGNIAHRYARGGFLHWDDLFQHGIAGLIRALEKFDPFRGPLFSTYGTWWIRQAITRAIADEERAIRIPVHTLEMLSRYEREMARARASGSRPSMTAVASSLQTTPEQVQLVVERSAVTIPLDDERHDRAIPWDEESVDNDLMREAIERVLQSLHAREAEVIRLRFGFDDGTPDTLEAIGQRFGLTRERIRQIEAKALRKLRGRVGQILDPAPPLPERPMEPTRRHLAPGRESDPEAETGDLGRRRLRAKRRGIVNRPGNVGGSSP